MSVRDDDFLLQAALDHTLPEEEFAHLEQRLLQEPALRARYYEYARLHHVLAEDHVGQSLLPGSQRRALRDTPASRLPLVQSFLAAAAILVALLVVAYFVTVKSPPDVTRLALGLETNASIVHAEGGKGSSTLHPGSRLILKRGSAELTLPNGVRAVVEGPAHLVNLGKNEVRLETGRAWFHVPPGAEGFICQTPTLRIIDLGTEFGVLVGPNQAEEVHVLKGEVRIEPHDRPDLAQALLGGQGVAREDSRFLSIPLNPNFATSLPHRVLVFADDFSEPDETPLHGKSPDTGAGPWDVEYGNPVIYDQEVDTSGAAKRAFAPLDCDLNENSNVLLLTIRTDDPDARTFHTDGWAGISLHTGEQERIFVGDPGGRSISWAIHPVGGQPVAPSPPLQGKHTVTLRYDFRSGLAELFEGNSTSGEPLASEWIAPGLNFDRLRLSNGNGGDIALRFLRVSVLQSVPGNP